MNDHTEKKKLVDWSKNHFSNIVIFFDISKDEIFKFLRVSTRMRAASLGLIPRIKLETSEKTPKRLQKIHTHQEIFLLKFRIDLVNMDFHLS